LCFASKADDFKQVLTLTRGSIIPKKKGAEAPFLQIVTFADRHAYNAC
jgi:hypothetical protein